MKNALSVDIEDWFQVGAFEKVIARDAWETIPARVEANTEKVLALFDEAGVKATFFTLGWVAARHPAVIRREEEFIERVAAADPDAIVVVEAAILIETGSYRRFDCLILVVCPEEQQIERAMHRDGCTRQEAEARLRRQMPIEEKRKFADFVIDTSGPKESTAEQARRVYEALRSMRK